MIVRSKYNIDNWLRNDKDQNHNSLYAIVHDLRSPLISIEGYTRRLSKEMRSALSVEGTSCLHHIQASVSHMNDLLDDLMALAQTGSVDNTASILDTQSLVEEVLSEMQQAPKGNVIEFCVQKGLPRILFNRKRAYQVFTNVIGNAAKFIGDANRPQIDIGFQDGEFYVKDNGSGIAPEYHQKIFELFTRINAEGIEGTGIGLPTTRKILESAGGSIRVESLLHQGACFYMRFPMPNENELMSESNEGPRELVIKNYFNNLAK